MRAPIFPLLVLGIALSGCTGAVRPPGTRDPLETVATRLALPLDAEAELPVATSAHGISRREALQIAFRENPEIAQHTSALGLAEADYRAAATLSNPVAGIGTRLPADGVGVLSLEFDLMGDLLKLLQRKARMEASGLKVEEAIFTISDALLDFATRVDKAYFDLQAAQHRHRLLVALASATAAEAARSQSLVAQELLDRTTALRHRILATQADLDARRAALEVAVARTMWARMLARPDDESLPLPAPELPPLPAMPSNLTSPGTLAIEHRFDLMAARKAIDARAVEHRIALDWRWWSVLEIGTMGERDSDGQLVMGPAINIALPVFDQGSAALMRTASELRRAQQRTATLALDIQQGANAAYARARALHDLAQRQHDEWLPLQSSLVEMLEKQVALGFSSQFALQQARRDHLQATGLYVDALRDYWLAEAVLRRAIGAAPSPEVGSLDPLAGGER